MNEYFTELFNRFDGITEDALKLCIDYANKQILAGTQSPMRVMYAAFEVYKRARLVEDRTRDISARIYFERLPKKMRYDFFQFIQLLAPEIREICARKYGNNSPYAKIEAAKLGQMECW